MRLLVDSSEIQSQKRDLKKMQLDVEVSPPAFGGTYVSNVFYIMIVSRLISVILPYMTFCLVIFCLV